MLNRCGSLGAFGLLVWLYACADTSSGQNRPGVQRPGAPKSEGRMQPSASNGLSLTASQRNGSRPLATEEGADFDVFLTNGSPSSVTVRSIDNLGTARLTL